MTLKHYALLSTIIALLLVLGAFRLGQATTSVTFDSAWWRDLTPGDRLSAIQGALSAYKSGYQQGSVDSSVQTNLVETTFAETLLEQYFTADRQKFLNGFYAFRANAIGNGLYDKLRKQAEASAAAKIRTNPSYRTLAGAPEFSKTFGTYADGITHYYENNPAQANTVMGYLIGCMADTRSSLCGKDF